MKTTKPSPKALAWSGELKEFVMRLFILFPLGVTLGLALSALVAWVR